jgi:hypothetical protein
MTAMSDEQFRKARLKVRDQLRALLDEATAGIACERHRR